MGSGQGVVLDTIELETESLRITLVVLSLRGVAVLVESERGVEAVVDSVLITEVATVLVSVLGVLAKLTQRQVMQPATLTGLVMGCPLAS